MKKFTSTYTGHLDREAMSRPWRRDEMATSTSIYKGPVLFYPMRITAHITEGL